VSKTFGYTTDAAQNIAVAANTKEGTLAYLSGSLVAKKIYVLCANPYGAPVTFRAVVYSEAGTLGGYTSALTLAAGSGKAWRALTIPSPFSLSQGNKWLLVHVGSGTLDIYIDPAIGNMAYNSDSYADGPSSPMGAYTPYTGRARIYVEGDLPNQAPYAPTLLRPAHGSTIDTDLPTTFEWVFSDPDLGDSQSARNWRYREVGTSTWWQSGWVNQTHATRTGAAGEFTVGKTYEWQVQVKDSQGLAGPWSASSQFLAGQTPNTPFITSPADGSTVVTANPIIAWSHPDQDAYQLRVYLSSSIPGYDYIYDSGVVLDAVARTAGIPSISRNGSYAIELRCRKDGLWSEWASAHVTVNTTPPATPTLVITADSDNARIVLEPTHPAPSGEQPTVVSQEIWRTTTGDAADAVRIVKELTPGAVWHDYTVASGVDYQYFVRAVGDTGAIADSALGS
jgi:hypothetical protein